MTVSEDRLERVLAEVRALGTPQNLAGQARFGIDVTRAWGVSIPSLRSAARKLGRDHAVAERLWATGVHELRILASMVDVPTLVTADQMERWVADFDSWDLCDQCCGNLFDRTSLAAAKAVEWAVRSEEFTKRAGFALMAYIAVHDKRIVDDDFLPYLTLIEQESDDNRNFVRKAVNWALRQIGKRNASLRAQALETAQRIQQRDTKAARWIAADAIRELNTEAVRTKLGLA